MEARLLRHFLVGLELFEEEMQTYMVVNFERCSRRKLLEDLCKRLYLPIRGCRLEDGSRLWEGIWAETLLLHLDAFGLGKSVGGQDMLNYSHEHVGVVCNRNDGQV